MNVCIVGIWHLGSVLCACLTEGGHTVCGVDEDAGRIERLNQGKAPLFEPGLDDLLAKHLRGGRLSFSTDLAAAASKAQAVWIAFDTPVDRRDRVDMRPVERAIRRLSGALQRGALLVISSQVPVASCEHFTRTLRRRNPRLEIVCTPENLRLGNAIACFMEPKRVVVGAESEAAFERFDELTSFISCERLRMSLRSAEMSKHALNAYLAVSVSFANEIASLCDAVGADVTDVMSALKTDERIGPRAFLSPGPGFAGGTLARDVRILERAARTSGLTVPVLSGALRTNERQKRVVLEKLCRSLGSLKGRTVAVLGLTYKPGTSTVRRSVALEIVKRLVHAGARARAFDPQADSDELARERVRGLERAGDVLSAARGADALVILTEWPEFRALDFSALARAMRRPLLIDAKNFLDAAAVRAAGFRYVGIGKPSFKAQRKPEPAARR